VRAHCLIYIETKNMAPGFAKRNVLRSTSKEVKSLKTQICLTYQWQWGIYRKQREKMLFD
jgi:hypothetical protein